MKDAQNIKRPSHRTTATRELMESYDWEPLANAAYSTNLALSNYHLLASMGIALSEHRFNLQDICNCRKNGSLIGLRPKTDIYKLPDRWEKCVGVGLYGNYFEDKIYVKTCFFNKLPVSKVWTKEIKHESSVNNETLNIIIIE